MKANSSINLGTVCHTAATLLLATEKIGDGSEMIFPPKNNHYRTARLDDVVSLAWDIVLAAEKKGIQLGILEPEE